MIQQNTFMCGFLQLFCNTLFWNEITWALMRYSNVKMLIFKTSNFDQSNLKKFVNSQVNFEKFHFYEIPCSKLLLNLITRKCCKIDIQTSEFKKLILKNWIAKKLNFQTLEFKNSNSEKWMSKKMKIKFPKIEFSLKKLNVWKLNWKKKLINILIKFGQFHFKNNVSPQC